MKTFNIIFKNNKFYQLDTGKRVYPKDGGIFLLASDDENFEENDPLNLPFNEDIKNSKAKLEEVKQIKNLKSYVLMLPANTILYFQFSLNKQKNDHEPVKYGFQLRLLEDLYLYYSTTWQEAKPAEVFDCKCVVEYDLYRNVDYFEPIYAHSLNEAYSKTRQFYFPNQGTPGASIYVVMETEKQETLKQVRNRFGIKDFRTI